MISIRIAAAATATAVIQMASEGSDALEEYSAADSVDVAEKANGAGNACYREGHFEAACEFYTSAMAAVVGVDDKGDGVDGQRLKRQSVSACRSKYYANRCISISSRERIPSLIGEIDTLSSHSEDWSKRCKSSGRCRWCFEIYTSMMPCVLTF